MDDSAPAFLDGPHGRIAYRTQTGGAPGIVWLGGFRSDMTGTKATFLAEQARMLDRAFLRFDYSGHGASDGRFEDGSIGDWRQDALAAIESLTQGPQILVASSMGAWIALLAALEMPQRVTALVLIAPAPDFTDDLLYAGLADAQKAALDRCGRIVLDEGGPAELVVTRRLIEDGRRWRLLDKPIPLTCPVRILHGMADADVPWHHAVRLAERLESKDVDLRLSKTGDHRLSTPGDLENLLRAVRCVA